MEGLEETFEVKKKADDDLDYGTHTWDGEKLGDFRSVWEVDLSGLS